MSYKIRETKNYIRFRQFNPDLCKKKSFRVKQVNDKIKLVLCKKKGKKKQNVQSILERKW
jgi:hypothetical protein